MRRYTGVELGNAHVAGCISYLCPPKPKVRQVRRFAEHPDVALNVLTEVQPQSFDVDSIREDLNVSANLQVATQAKYLKVFIQKGIQLGKMDRQVLIAQIQLLYEPEVVALHKVELIKVQLRAPIHSVHP